MIIPEPLTAAAFAPFGCVIETDGAERFEINGGLATRFHALAAPDPGPEGRAVISIFRGRRQPSPPRLAMLERHPLGSQAFLPLSDAPWLVAVAEHADAPLRVFAVSGRQGVQYARGVWHHPLIVLAAEQDFVVVDRDGPGENLETVALTPPAIVDLAGLLGTGG